MCDTLLEHATIPVAMASIRSGEFQLVQRNSFVAKTSSQGSLTSPFLLHSFDHRRTRAVLRYGCTSAFQGFRILQAHSDKCWRSMKTSFFDYSRGLVVAVNSWDEFVIAEFGWRNNASNVHMVTWPFPSGVQRRLPLLQSWVLLIEILQILTKVLGILNVPLLSYTFPA